MSDSRRPGEEAAIAAWLAEHEPTKCPPGGQEDLVLGTMPVGRAARNAAKGKARSRTVMHSYWKQVQAERKKRADLERAYIKRKKQSDG